MIEAFNTMGEELEQSRNTVQQTMDELSESMDKLESRVMERTRELEKALDKVHVLGGFCRSAVHARRSGTMMGTGSKSRNMFSTIQMHVLPTVSVLIVLLNYTGVFLPVKKRDKFSKRNVRTYDLGQRTAG